MSIHSRLSDLLDYMLEVQLAVPDQLLAAERDRSGTAANWSLKDTLAHNAEWAGRHLDDLEALERGQAWPEGDDGEIHGENEAIFETHRQKSWDEVRAMLREVYGRGQAYLDRVSEETLQAPVPVEPPRPSWRHLAGNYIQHPMIHVWEFATKNNQRDLVPRYFGESFAERLLALADDDQWRGTTLYNLACNYALVGETEQAIKNLGQALVLAPGLKEWSQQDSDLDSLRDEPAYQALYD